MIIEKWHIVLGGNCFFFGLCAAMAFVAWIFPDWDARKLARQQRRLTHHDPDPQTEMK